MPDAFPTKTRIQAHNLIPGQQPIAQSSLGDVPHELHVCDERALPGLAQVRLDVDKLHGAREPAHLHSRGIATGLSLQRSTLRLEHDVQCRGTFVWCCASFDEIYVAMSRLKRKIARYLGSNIKHGVFDDGLFPLADRVTLSFAIKACPGIVISRCTLPSLGPPTFLSFFEEVLGGGQNCFRW